MNRFFIFTAVLSLLFSVLSGCQTSNALKIPGETELITKNIASEYFTIAEAYSELKKWDKACTYYKLAMQEKTLRLSAYYKLARCYALSGDYASSTRCYSELLELDPENKDLKLSLAYVKGMNGNTEEALEMYKSLTQLYPNDSSVLVNYINLLLFTEKKDEAKEQFLILEEKFPDNSEIKRLSEKVNAGSDVPSESENKPSLPPPEAN